MVLELAILNFPIEFKDVFAFHILVLLVPDAKRCNHISAPEVVEDTFEESGQLGLVHRVIFYVWPPIFVQSIDLEYLVFVRFGVCGIAAIALALESRESITEPSVIQEHQEFAFVRY